MSDDDDFDFSDHDLDELPADAIAQFEAAAIRATQRRQSDYGLDDELVNLDDSAGGDMEETTIDESIHRGPLHSSFPPRSQADPHQLLARIKALEQARAREKRDARDLHAQLQTKAGEADTLRRRHDADARRHDRLLADEQQRHRDELAALRAEMEALRRERESQATHSLFLQHDVRDAALVPRARKPMAARPKSRPAQSSPVGTPKKKPRAPLADGFDDGDVLMPSPSRTREKSKPATPTLAGKRKRTVVDASPIPLQLSEPPADRDTEPVVGDTHVDGALLDFFRADDRRFRLLHRLLAHISSNGTDRVLDALAQHAFPSDPSKRLSSIFYDALAAKAFADVHTLALDMCLALCHLWAQCLAEKHYAPVNLLLDALHFLLACERCETACDIKSRFVPLMIDSIDLVANPLSKAAKVGPDSVKALYASGHRDVTAQIDVLECLDILHLIATSCVSTSPAEAAQLWELIPSDFTLMLLNKEQPIAQISLVLRILATSALSSSIGPITTSDSQADSQANREDALIGRLTNILTETPTTTADPSAPSPPDPLAPTDTLELRLQVIDLLTTLSIPHHGAARLATNRICTGRLIKYLDRLLATLYKTPLAPTHHPTIASINATTKLIYHIATANPGFDMKSKLVNTLGGQHAYLVGLTRLAFSEGLVLEQGIEEAVVDMAHAILDEGLSLEEGEAFGGVFSTGLSVV